MRPYNTGAQSGEDVLGGRAVFCWQDGLQPKWIPTHPGMLSFCLRAL